ncbi:hypothetical protein ACLB2K_057526 [Fragaria x ananassa]
MASAMYSTYPISSQLRQPQFFPSPAWGMRPGFHGQWCPTMIPPFAGLHSVAEPTWYPDTGATHHMTALPVNNPQSYVGPHNVYMGNGDSMSVSHTGSLPMSLGSLSRWSLSAKFVECLHSSSCLSFCSFLNLAQSFRSPVFLCFRSFRVSHPGTLSAVTRYCPLWARWPSRFCFRQLRSSFPVGHPSWDCSSIIMLNLGVPIPSEAAEPPKGLALDWMWACTYTAHNPSPLADVGYYNPPPLGVRRPRRHTRATRQSALWARWPSRFCFRQLRSSFPVGHPSWDCSSIIMLNLGVPIPSEAAEPPKGLALDWMWASFLLSAAAAIRSSDAASARQRTPEAYVTLLYGDEFLLGVRVLGKSIRDTGSTKDMVVLVSDGVSGYAMSLLKADGWIVEKISLLANPNQVRPMRFWGVYTKLKIFNMTNYKKVVYLDADTIVVKSVEDLFECSKFCANLKHSERLNSGVIVVEPSERVFQDMMGKVTTLESYTGGDQGFLNSYYSDFPNAHVFDPNLAPEVRKSRPVPEMERLSTLYNADVGLYMLANKWMVNESELRVIHYTLGPLKPWDWWTSWLLKPVDVWQDVRKGLKDSLPGTGGGINPNDALVVKILFSIPFLALLFCYYRSFLQTREYFGS